MTIEDRLRAGLHSTGDGLDFNVDDELELAIASGRRRKRNRAAGAAAAVLTVMALLAIGVTVLPSDRESDLRITTEPDRSRPRVEWTPSTVSTVPTTTTTTAPRRPGPARPDNTGDFVNGRQIVDVTSVDADNRTVTFDGILWFSGLEAMQAIAEDGGDPVNDYTNDYYTRNDNPALRTLTVSTDATIDLLGGYPDTWEEFVDRAIQEPDELFEGFPFWLTIRNGVVIGIEEQYHP